MLLFFCSFIINAADNRYNTIYKYQPPKTYQNSGNGLKITNFANTYKLSISSRFSTNQIELFNKKVQLLIIPGMSKVVYNGTRYSLLSPPSFCNGTLIIPNGIVSLIPRVVLPPKRKYIANDFFIGNINSNKTVIIDPGHGGRDPGAIGRRGLKEKNINLEVALRLQRFLRKAGVRVVMTRTSDTFPSLQQRARIANKTSNSIYVSIHANFASSRNARGIETFVLSDRVSNSYRSYKASTKYNVKKSNRKLFGHGKRMAIDKICRKARRNSVTLANSIQGNLVRAVRASNRGVKRENLHVLRENYFSPAVLVEVGFLSNRTEERNLNNSKYQTRLAYGIYKGIAAYLKTSNGKNQTSWMNGHQIQIARR